MRLVIALACLFSIFYIVISSFDAAGQGVFMCVCVCVCGVGGGGG